MSQLPDAFASIIGHERAVLRLRLMLKNGAMPHAVLFAGGRHLGKRALALSCASALLDTADPMAHPDFRLVERRPDEKTGKLRKNIPIDDIRGLRDHLRLSSFLGGAKVALIDEAETLSEEAANAMLKTLEEPSAGSTIFLAAHDAARLPATVRSRAAVIELRRADDAAVAAAMQARGASPDMAARAVECAAGRPGVALRFLEDSDMVDWYANELRRWTSLRSAPLHRRLALAGELTPPRADREETVERLRDVIGIWEAALRRELAAGSASSARSLDHLFRLRETLTANVQPRLLLEQFAMTLGR